MASDLDNAGRHGYRWEFKRREKVDHKCLIFYVRLIDDPQKESTKEFHSVLPAALYPRLGSFILQGTNAVSSV